MASETRVDLGTESDLVHRAGRLALTSGHGSYRVKSHMSRVGQAVGLDQVTSRVALTEISTSAIRGDERLTEVSEVRHIGINADRMADLERFIGGLGDRHYDATEISAGLDRISSKPALYPPIINAFAAGIACAAFAFLNSGGPIECTVVLIAASVGQFVRRRMISRGVNQVGVTMLAAVVASLIYLLVVWAAGFFLHISSQHFSGYVSAVLFLIPGFPLVTGALDLARLDLSAGIARLTYAMLILSSAAISLWFVSSLAGLAPIPMGSYDLAPGPLWALRALASFVAVYGFALMFNSPVPMALGAAGIGMLANIMRIAIIELEFPPQAAAAVAALMVGLLARLIASPLRVPRLTISVPAVVIMVPGVLAYRAIYGFNTGDTVQALGFAAEAALIVISLAIGLAVSRMLTDREWTFEFSK